MVIINAGLIDIPHGLFALIANKEPTVENWLKKKGLICGPRSPLIIFIALENSFEIT